MRLVWTYLAPLITGPILAQRRAKAEIIQNHQRSRRRPLHEWAELSVVPDPLEQILLPVGCAGTSRGPAFVRPRASAPRPLRRSPVDSEAGISSEGSSSRENQLRGPDREATEDLPPLR